MATNTFSFFSFTFFFFGNIWKTGLQLWVYCKTTWGKLGLEHKVKDCLEHIVELNHDSNEVFFLSVSHANWVPSGMLMESSDTHLKTDLDTPCDVELYIVEPLSLNSLNHFYSPIWLVNSYDHDWSLVHAFFFYI